MTEQHLTIEVPSKGTVPALLASPADARAMFVMGHGAGAGMRHAFMETISQRLVARDIATLRYEFPYMAAGRRSPDAPRTLEEAVRAALAAAVRTAPDLPLYAGGKSMGGRISSHVAAHDPPPELRGLVFLGYPLHAPKKPAAKRAEHLRAIRLPMLFLQGTRDDLADLTLLRPIVEQLGGRATLRIIEGGDHSFRVLKRSGRSDEEVLEELADAVSGWLATHATHGSAGHGAP